MVVSVVSEGILKILLILIVISATFLLTRRDILSLFRSYTVQSLFLMLISFTLYIQEKEVILLYTAILTFVSKVWFIPFFLEKVQQKLNINRDLEFNYVQPTSSIFLSLVIITIVYFVFSNVLQKLPVTPIFIFGAILGISLTLIGMVVCFSRKKIITKIIGYLTMENGVVLFSLFSSELPFMIEIFVVMDLVTIVIITAIMAFGMNTSIQEFHAHINPFRKWFKGGQK